MTLWPMEKEAVSYKMKGYSSAYDSWVNKDNMNADKLVQKFSESEPIIRTTSILSKLYPLPTIASLTLDKLSIPTILPNDMSAPATSTNTIIEISPTSSPSPTIPTLSPPLSWVSSNPDAIRNPFLNMVYCSLLALSNLGELSALALAVCSYFTCHGTLPCLLEDRALFHHINTLNVYHFVQTNGQASDCTITNFEAWSGAIHCLRDVLAPYMLNAF